MTTTSHDGGAMKARTTREVLDRYNEAFRLHDSTLLDDVVADDCVIEDTSPAPDGMRREGVEPVWRDGPSSPRTALSTSPPRQPRSTGTSLSNLGFCNGATAKRPCPRREPHPHPRRPDRRGARLREGLMRMTGCKKNMADQLCVETENSRDHHCRP